jgi:hypothetical protein
VALRGELDDAELGGGDGIAAGLCDPAWAGARKSQLLACPFDQRGGVATVGEIGPLRRARSAVVEPPFNWRAPALVLMPHCDSDGARATSDRELARADMVPVHRMQSVWPMALQLVVRCDSTCAS